jgi:hypothetical protein
MDIDKLMQFAAHKRKYCSYILKSWRFLIYYIFVILKKVQKSKF